MPKEKQADKEQFDEVFVYFLPTLDRRAKYLLNDVPHLSDAAISKTYINGLSEFYRYDKEKAQIQTWLDRILTNACIDERDRLGKTKVGGEGDLLTNKHQLKDWIEEGEPITDIESIEDSIKTEEQTGESIMEWKETLEGMWEKLQIKDSPGQRELFMFQGDNLKYYRFEWNKRFKRPPKGVILITLLAKKESLEEIGKILNKTPEALGKIIKRWKEKTGF